MSEKESITGEAVSSIITLGAIGIFGLIAIRLISEGMEKSVEDLKDSIVAPFVNAGAFVEDLGTNLGTTVTDTITTVTDVIDNVDNVVRDTVKKTKQTVDSLKEATNVITYAASKDYDVGPAATVFKVINNAGDSAKAVADDLMKAVDIGSVWDAYEQRKIRYG